jgi:inter-alpha-trypsin inhibitor heavy chain H2
MKELMWLEIVVVCVVILTDSATTEDATVAAADGDTKTLQTVERRLDTSHVRLTKHANESLQQQASRRVHFPIVPYSVTVRSDVVHRYATTTVTHKFLNDQPTGNSMAAAVFECLLPKSAVVVNFTASVDGRLYQVERQQDVDEGPVRPGRPRLAGGRRDHVISTSRGQAVFGPTRSISRRYLVDRNLFRTETELAPNGRIEYQLTYEQLLTRRHGVYDLSTVIGRVRGQGQSEGGGDVRVEVRIRETSDISVLHVILPDGTDRPTSINGTDDSQQLRIRRVSSNVAHVTYVPTAAEQSKWMTSSDDDDVIGMLSVRYDVRHQLDAGEIQFKGGHFVHHFSPVGLQAIDKNIVFLIDCSDQSMTSSKMADIKTAMIEILDNQRPSDMFNVIGYGPTLRYWNSDVIVRASSENVGNAKAFVASLGHVTGGANVNDALLRAVDFLVKQEESDPLATRLSMVLLITDSAPSAGIVDSDRILANVRQASGGRVSVFACGLSPEVGRPFLDRVTQQNRGWTRRIGVDLRNPQSTPTSTAAVTVRHVTSFYREISSPLLKSVRVRYDETADESSLTELDFPAYFAGSELVIAGRLAGANVQAASGSSARPGGGGGSGGHLSVKVSGSSAQGYMSLDARMKTPRLDRAGAGRGGGGSGRVGQQAGVVEKIWACLMVQRLERKALLETGNGTVRQMALDSVQHIARQYSFATSMTSLVLRNTKQPNSTISVSFYNMDDEQRTTPDNRLHQHRQQQQQQQAAVSGRRRPPPLLNSAANQRPDRPVSQRKTFVDNDPHFVINVNGLSKAVCFDVDGNPGTVYQLLHDKASNIAVNSLVVAAPGKRQGAKRRTYIGKLAVLAAGSCVVIVDPHRVTVGSTVLSWTRNSTSLPCGTTRDVTVDVTAGRHVTVTSGRSHRSGQDVVVLRVLRHIVRPDHPFKVDYLGFYVERSDGLSEYTHGLIGQFIHQTARQIRSSVHLRDVIDGSDTLRIVEKLTFSGPHMSHRTVTAELSERRDMEDKRRVPCWHVVGRNGRGLIRGTPDSYAVPHLLVRKSSFAAADIQRETEIRL